MTIADKILKRITDEPEGTEIVTASQFEGETPFAIQAALVAGIDDKVTAITTSASADAVFISWRPRTEDETL